LFLADGCRRGQAFAADFIASVVLFFAILLVVTSAWGRLQSDAAAASAHEALASFSFAASDNLLRSQGFPQDWNASTVQSAGFASSEALVLDPAKLMAFLDANYSAQRAALATGAYGFSLEFFSGNQTDLSGVIRQPVAYYAVGEYGLYAAIDASNYSWDYYWGGAGAFTEPQHGSARAFYSGSKIAALNELLANQSEYATIVVDAPNFSSDELAAVNLTALRSFVETGGVLFYAGDGSASAPLVGENFSVSFNRSPAARGGTVVDPRFLLRGVPAGANASFANSHWAVHAAGAALESVVADSSNASESLVARWPLGWGLVYYLADYSGASFEGFGDGPQVFNAVGWQLKFGSAPSEAQDVFVVNRLCLIGGDKRRWDSAALAVWSS